MTDVHNSVCGCKGNYREATFPLDGFVDYSNKMDR